MRNCSGVEGSRVAGVHKLSEYALGLQLGPEVMLNLLPLSIVREEMSDNIEGYSSTSINIFHKALKEDDNLSIYSYLEEMDLTQSQDQA